MKNEYGEIICDREITSLAERVFLLSENNIDKLWKLCGFVMEDREKGLLAIRRMDIEKIKKNKSSAKKMVVNLFNETPIEKLKQHLSEIEMC